MSDNDILDKVRAVIIAAKIETVVLSPEQLTPDASLEGYPVAMDSIDFVKMIVGIEETFGLVAEDDDFIVSSMRTVSDVVNVVKTRLKALG
jgi:acyl carrier protein